jgi:hypothetical protein
MSSSYPIGPPPKGSKAVGVITLLTLILCLILAACSTIKEPDPVPTTLQKALTIQLVDAAGDSGIIMGHRGDSVMVVVMWMGNQYQTATCTNVPEECTIQGNGTYTVDREGFQEWFREAYDPVQKRVESYRQNQAIDLKNRIAMG